MYVRLRLAALVRSATSKLYKLQDSAKMCAPVGLVKIPSASGDFAQAPPQDFG